MPAAVSRLGALPDFEAFGDHYEEAGVSDSLAIFSRAAVMLAEADTVQKAKELKNMALTAADWAKRKGMGEDAIQHCRSYAFEAERKLGQLLKETERARGAAVKRNGVIGGDSVPTLPEIGISRNESMNAQRVAALPDEEFAALKEGKKTRKAVNREAKRKAKRAPLKPPQNSGFITDLASANGPFGCIYIDPPWKYGNQATRASSEDHYGTMTVEAIRALPIASLSAEKAHLHLWTTNGFLFESQQLMEAWGFEFKSSFIWVKPQIGMGNYWRCSHEFLLLGIKGGQTGRAKNLKSWGEFPRGKHSEKPEQVRALIEQLSPGPYLEIFGRREAKGWTVFGNQKL